MIEQNKSIDGTKATFSVYAATIYGLEEAILIYFFSECIMNLKERKKNCYNGKTWVRLTLNDLLKEFPYFKNKHKIRRAIESLIAQNILVKDKFKDDFKDFGSHYRMDQTLLYSFVDEDYWLPMYYRNLVDNPVALFNLSAKEGKYEQK